MFKVGDRVVVIVNRDVFPTDKTLIGKTFEIIRIRTYDNDDASSSEYYVANDKSHFFNNEIILEEVYNSPLYKALREED